MYRISFNSFLRNQFFVGLKMGQLLKEILYIIKHNEKFYCYFLYKRIQIFLVTLEVESSVEVEVVSLVDFGAFIHFGDIFELHWLLVVLCSNRWWLKLKSS